MATATGPNRTGVTVSVAVGAIVLFVLYGLVVVLTPLQYPDPRSVPLLTTGISTFGSLGVLAAAVRRKKATWADGLLTAVGYVVALISIPVTTDLFALLSAALLALLGIRLALRRDREDDASAGATTPAAQPSAT